MGQVEAYCKGDNMDNQMTEVTEKKLAEFKPLPAFANSLVPTNLGEAMEMAKMLSRSNIVPKEFFGKPENCLVAIGLGMEIGLPPLQAVQAVMVVNGRPSLWGDSVLALVLGSGLCEKFEEDSSSDISKNGYGRCVVKRVGMKEMEIKFSVDDAKKAGLWGKSGPWSQYPTRMLQMRARSWALRDCFPDVLKGIQVREEVDDYQVKKTIQMPQAIYAKEADIAEEDLKKLISSAPVEIKPAPETIGDRIVKARNAFAETYGATEKEIDNLISEMIAESDGSAGEEEILGHLNRIWSSLKKGEVSVEVIFNRGVKEKKT